MQYVFFYIIPRTEYTMQTSSDRIAGCGVHRFTCTGRIHLSRRGERASAIAQLVPENGRSAPGVRIDATTSRRYAQCKDTIFSNEAELR